MAAAKSAGVGWEFPIICERAGPESITWELTTVFCEGAEITPELDGKPEGVGGGSVIPPEFISFRIWSTRSPSRPEGGELSKSERRVLIF
jgi:hypothetical protein